VVECIDLRQYGERFHVWNETERRRAWERDDPWDMNLRGRLGFIAPWGPTTLVACTNSMITTRKILAAVPGAKIAQDGDDGQNVTFPGEAFEVVAAIMQLRKRRKLPEKSREAFAAGRATGLAALRAAEVPGPERSGEGSTGG